MEHRNIKVLFLFIHVCISSCFGNTSVRLNFNSHNCDEEPRRLTENKYYILTWNGQDKPKLCSFTFIGGTENQQNARKRSFRSSRSRSSRSNYVRRKHYKVCIEPLRFDLSGIKSDVVLRIANFTRTSWEFDRYAKMKRSCVDNAYKLDISILLPSHYRAPNTTAEHIKLKISASLMKDKDWGKLTNIIVGVGLGFVAVAGIIFTCCKKGIPCDLCDSCLSRAFCCKKSHSAQDEISEMSDIQGASFSEHSFVSPTNPHPEKAPVSYHSVQHTDNKAQPMAPPPTYEEVTGVPIQQ